MASLSYKIFSEKAPRTLKMTSVGPWTYQEVRDALITSVMGYAKNNGFVGYKLTFFLRHDLNQPMMDGQLFYRGETYVVKRMPSRNELVRVCLSSRRVVPVEHVVKTGYVKKKYTPFRWIGLHGKA